VTDVIQEPVGSGDEPVSRRFSQFLGAFLELSHFADVPLQVPRPVAQTGDKSKVVPAHRLKFGQLPV
jgi:hypothetical protein